MPLARILTTFPERAESLAQQLRDHGYTVEFLSPEKAGMLRADLEIDFEICDQKVVLRRAAELASKLHTDIAVSPEALPANFAVSESQIYVSENEIVEVPSHITDPFVETFLAQGDRTGQIHNLEQSEHMVSLPPDMLTAEPPKANRPEQSSIEAEPDQAPAAQSFRSIEIPIVPDPEPHAGSFGFEKQAFENQTLQNHSFENQTFENQTIEDQPFGDRTFEAANQPSQVTDAAHLADDSQPVHAPKPEWLERAGSLASSAMAGAKRQCATLAASGRRLGADCIEWINVRLAAAQDARHRRQIEAEKQRELAQARAEELEIARDAAAARLQELLRERGGLTDRQPVPPTAEPFPTYQHSEAEPDLESAAFYQTQPAWFEKFPGWFGKFKDLVLTRKYGQQWEAVLMGVAAACALFVVGVAVNSFRPHAALSNSITQPSPASAPVSAKAVPASPSSGSQPYKGVTVQGGKPGVTLLPAAPVKAGPVQVANNKPSPRESDVTVRHINKPSPRNDGVASDVTIRHFNQQPKPAARNNSDGVKRFSDLD
jgi:hypothetical protein